MSLMVHLIVITFFSHVLLVHQIVQMAPVFDSVFNVTIDTNNSEPDLSTTPQPGFLLEETTTKSSFAPTLVSQLSPVPEHTIRFRLKQVVPVDLYNPCRMEDENWSESYFQVSSDQTTGGERAVDDKYLLDPNDAEAEGSLPDIILNEHLNSHSDDEHQLKVTLTQLVGKARFGYDLLKEMIEKTSHLQGLVTDMIRKVSAYFPFC